MARSWSRLITGSITMALLALGPISGAVAATTVDVAEEAGVLWTTASVDATGARITVTVLTPKSNGRRTVWQRCSFPNSGAGDYRCGTDAAMARTHRSGTWMVKVRAGDSMVGRSDFTL